jgi:hypothetical protein
VFRWSPNWKLRGNLAASSPPGGVTSGLRSSGLNTLMVRVFLRQPFCPIRWCFDSCLLLRVGVIAYFVRRYAASAWIALATILILLVYKIGVIGR